MEALHDPSTGLTYPALTGVSKQSVQDVEHLFSPGVIDFVQKRKYDSEAKFLNVIRNWKRAIDERGLHEGERQRYLLEFKTFICEDIMPWYSKGMTDFSLLEVNRYMYVTLLLSVHILIVTLCNP